MVIEGDPTDESPNRPRDGFSMATGVPDIASLGFVVYDRFNADTMDKVSESLIYCGLNTQRNPTAGTTTISEGEAAATSIQGLTGYTTAVSTKRMYDDGRPDSYSRELHLYAMSFGLLVRVTASGTSADPESLSVVDDLFEEAIELLARATQP